MDEGYFVSNTVTKKLCLKITVGTVNNWIPVKISFHEEKGPLYDFRFHESSLSAAHVAESQEKLVPKQFPNNS